MKTFMMGLVFCSCAVSAWGEVFQMDRKGDAIVEVVEVGNEYKVRCRFSPQTKFSDAVNARFNDNKGDSLCKKGIARYLNASPKDVVSVVGQYSAAPVKTVGGKLCYSFGIPVAGCKVDVAGNVQGQKIVHELPIATPPVMAKAAKPEQVVDVVQSKVTEKPFGEKSEGHSKVAKKALKERSYVCVTRYRETNGCRKMVAQREYRGIDFKSHEEFDRLCQDEFARVRAIGEANLKAVRNLVK